ncbi:hypothetical protein [Rhodococcus sp. P1Y]|uniref:hypothetical protein n=1 Tax=Rhodococcus sp. P1Y TaxID=1302308 RepID=UPI000EAC98E4|nr:hypothetical protein [Rhodococcus sp. P1Y]AYJ48650.1 hypothetical protein D8W71_10260 [Rhodococcus sp. P1Y]
MNSDKDPLLLRRELVRTGTTDSDIRSATRKGTLGRVRRGVFVPTDVLSASSPEELHALQVRSHAAAAGNRLVASHQSAAILHGLPMWSPNLERVHFTIDRPNGGRKSRTRHVHPPNGGRKSRTRHVHPGVLKSNDVVHIGGLAVTSPNRTVADLCRSLDFEAAVCVGDAALAQGVATADGVADTLNRSGRRSLAKALRALEFCSPHSESVGESRTRVQLSLAGVPVPTLQVDVYSPKGDFLGRVDFLFEELGVILEFDGNVKYSKFVPLGQTPSSVVIAEKKREDGLRSFGWVVVRVYWSDLEHPERLVEKLQRAFDTARTLPRPQTILRHAA